MADRGAYEFTGPTGSAPDAPVLSSPGMGATWLPTSLTLDWLASTPSIAESYGVQLSTNSGFSPNVLDTTGITTLSAAVTSLSLDTVYYWHVNGTNSIGAGSYSATSTFSTGNVPGATTLVSPSSGATATATTLDLSWSTVSFTDSYGLQLSTNSGFSPLLLDSTGITSVSVSVTGLENITQYFWKVNAANSFGTGTYSATSDFTTIIAAPARPIITTPSDGSVNIPISTDLVWGAALLAATYSVDLSTYSGFDSTILSTTSVVGTTVSVSGLVNLTDYYWRVMAFNTGGASLWSVPSRFTTIIAFCDTITQASPADGALDVSKAPQMSWNADSRAASYNLQVAVGAAFSTTTADVSNILDTVAAVELDYSKTYYWRVRGVNAAGNGSWSATRSYFTEAYTQSAGATITPNFDIDKTTRDDDEKDDSERKRRHKNNDRYDYIDSDMACWKLTTVTSNYSMVASDELVLVLANSPTIMLPRAASVSLGRRYVVANNSTLSIMLDAYDLNINSGATISIAAGAMKKIFKTPTQYLAY